MEASLQALETGSVPWGPSNFKVLRSSYCRSWLRACYFEVPCNIDKSEPDLHSRQSLNRLASTATESDRLQKLGAVPLQLMRPIQLRSLAHCGGLRR